MTTRSLPTLLLTIVVPGLALAQAPADDRIPVWREGEAAGTADPRTAASEGLLVVDLGDGWTPALFAGGRDARGRDRPSTYGPTFAALAREDYAADPSGRARRDRYLEPYGIPPALSVLRTRLEQALARRCREEVDERALAAFPGLDVAEGETWSAAAPDVPERFLQGLLFLHDVFGTERVPRPLLTSRERRLLDLHGRWTAWRNGLFAVQQRLRCAGHLRGAYTPGEYDVPTRNALAELERRHRIYAQGRLVGATLEALRTPAAELERRAVVRVLTERALLAAGVIEDASVVDTPDGWRRRYYDSEGRAIEMRDLEAELAERVVTSFGLQTPESTAAWLAGLGELPAGGHRRVALEQVALPPYYGSRMDLSVVIDRGDVWYDLPFDELGRPRSQPVERRPTLSLHVRWLGQDILLARYPTTIGSWRVEASAEGERWRYYESPAGPAAWQRIVSAPVWLPPTSTPGSDLVTQYRVTEEGEVVREVKRSLLGPGYASAYGLVAAYHRSVTRRVDRALVLGPDVGIRTHGSVDYTSVWQRASHGCHRLHNHRAIRLFEFVLAHRRFRRLGETPIDFRFRVDAGEIQEEIRITQAGYEHELEVPLPVEVLPGTVRGELRSASALTYPVLRDGPTTAAAAPR